MVIYCIYFDLRTPSLTLHETVLHPYLHLETSNRTPISTPCFKWNGHSLNPCAMPSLPLTPSRLENLLSRFAGLSVLVVGDFFLDKYLVLDPALDEPSLETGLAAHQVVARRSMPGAAGTVTANLRALGVGQLHALGITGRDGEGYELRQGLSAMGVHLEGLIESPDRFTPTYIKPMNREPGGERESNRLDVQNRTPTPGNLEDRIIQCLRNKAPRMDGLVVLDQVSRRNTGVVTDRVREAICDLGRSHPDLVVLADSRERIGEFRHVILKGNRSEIHRAAQSIPTPGEDRPVRSDMDRPVRSDHEAGGAPDSSDRTDRTDISGRTDRSGRTDGSRRSDRSGRSHAAGWGQALFERDRDAGEGPSSPVFVTLGEDGLLAIDDDGCRHLPGIRVPGPLDPVGAGDSVTAGIAASLAAGATHAEAGLVGNLVASITVRQLGVTGTASPGQVMEGLAAPG